MYEATGLRPNLDYPAGLTYHLMDFDVSAVTPILVAAGLPGRTARIAWRLAGKPARTSARARVM
jgi:citrate synthase